MECIVKDRIKHNLYHPQPLNYKRVEGNERKLYEWILTKHIELVCRKPIKYRLWPTLHINDK